MKILQVTPYYYPSFDIGGTAKAVHDLSLGLMKRGHTVDIFTTDIFNKYSRVPQPLTHQKNESISVHYFKNVSNTLAFTYHLYLPLLFFPYSFKHLRKYDVVHFHEIYTLFHLWAGFWSHQQNIPYVISSHNTVGILKKAGRIQQKKLFYLLGGLGFLRRSFACIALTNEEYQSYQNLRIEEKKIFRVPNGIDTNQNSIRVKPKMFRDKFHLDENAKILLFLGRIHSIKKIESLIEALSLLHKGDKKYYLLIGGPTEDERYRVFLENLIDEKQLNQYVKFLGSLDENGKQDAFTSADLFVLPSHTEGIPMSVLEAGLSGLPLLVTIHCGITEIESYHAGKYIRGNPYDLAQSIEAIFSQKDFRLVFGANAQRMVKEKFNIEKTVDTIEKIYKSAAK